MTAREQAPKSPQTPESDVTQGSGERDLHGFASAFTDSVRRDGAHSRTGRALLISGAVVAAATGGALLFGALSGGAKADTATSGAKQTSTKTPSASPGVTHGAITTPSGSSGTTPATSATSSAPSPRSSSGVSGALAIAPSPSSKTSAPPVTTTNLYAGPGCSNSGENFGMYSYYSGTNPNGTTGWSTQSGGYSANGCSGEYVSMPLNGSATGEDNHVLWKFTKVPTGQACTIKLFIPAATSIVLVGGDPADYSYTVNGSSTTAGSFTVNQIADRGRWATGPTTTTTTGEVDVRLANTGIDYDSSNLNAHDAASAVDLSCAKSS